MKPRKELPLAVQVENLELANQTLKNYIQTLEEKIANYEKVLQHCPRYRAEQQLEEEDWEDDDDFDDSDDFDDFDDFEDEDDFDEDFDDDFDDDFDEDFDDYEDE